MPADPYRYVHMNTTWAFVHMLVHTVGCQDCNEAHHRSVHSLDAVNAAVALPACDTFNRRLPDKAIDLLGKAGLRARCAAREHSLASASPDPYAGDCVPASSLAEGQQALQARVGALKVRW